MRTTPLPHEAAWHSPSSWPARSTPHVGFLWRGPRSLLELLLRPEHVGVAALLLPAVHGPRVEARVALPADHLVAIVLPCKHRKGGLDDATSETENQVQRGLLLDVV